MTCFLFISSSKEHRDRGYKHLSVCCKSKRRVHPTRFVYARNPARWKGEGELLHRRNVFYLSFLPGWLIVWEGCAVHPFKRAHFPRPQVHLLMAVGMNAVLQLASTCPLGWKCVKTESISLLRMDSTCENVHQQYTFFGPKSEQHIPKIVSRGIMSGW